MVKETGMELISLFATRGEVSQGCGSEDRLPQAQRARVSRGLQSQTIWIESLGIFIGIQITKTSLKYHL